MLAQNKIKIGIKPINWTENTIIPEYQVGKLEDHIKQMALCGYQGCEFDSNIPQDIVSLKATLAPYKLQIASAEFKSHFSCPHKQKGSLERFKVHAQFLAYMGAKVVVISELENSIQNQNIAFRDNQPTLTQPQWDTFIAGLLKAGEIAHEFGLQVAYHPQVGTVVQSMSDISTLMNGTDPKQVSLLLDTGHLYVSDSEPLEVIRLFSDRVHHVHLSDVCESILQESLSKNLSFSQAYQQGLFVTPGEGVLDFKEIFTALNNINYTGWVLVNTVPHPNQTITVNKAKNCRTNIKKLTGI